MSITRQTSLPLSDEQCRILVDSLVEGVMIADLCCQSYGCERRLMRNGRGRRLAATEPSDCNVDDQWISAAKERISGAKT